MASSDDIFAGLAGATKGVSDVLGTLLQFKLRDKENYIDIEDIPQELRDELNINQNSGRINKSLIPLYKQPEYIDINTGKVYPRGQRPYQQPQAKTPIQEDVPVITEEKEREIGEAGGTVKRGTRVAPALKPVVGGVRGGGGFEKTREAQTNELIQALKARLSLQDFGQKITSSEVQSSFVESPRFKGADWNNKNVIDLLNKFPVKFETQESGGFLGFGKKKTQIPVFDKENINLPTVKKRKPLSSFER